MVKAKAVFVAFLTQEQAKKVRPYIKFGFFKEGMKAGQIVQGQMSFHAKRHQVLLTEVGRSWVS